MVVRIFIVYYKGYKIYLKLNFEEKKMEWNIYKVSGLSPDLETRRKISLYFC